MKAHRRVCAGIDLSCARSQLSFLGRAFHAHMIDARSNAAPRRVLALAREGYSWGTIKLGDLGESLTYGGFVKLATSIGGRVWVRFIARCRRLHS